MAELTGATLKKLREEREIPLEQVAAATRIRLQVLQDLEDEEYGELASPTQARGFLKIYANYLGLSEADFGPEPATETPRQARAESEPEATLVPSAEDPAPTATQQGAAQSPEPASTTATSHEAPSPPPSRPSSKPAKASSPPSAPAKPRGMGGWFKRSPSEQKTSAAAGPPKPSASQLILNDIGRQLTARRNYLGIPWDLLVEQTHINKDQIIALEQGDLNALSSPIQARGLLNTYARFLNLDSEMLLVRFADALQQRRLESQGTRKPRQAARVLPQVLTTLKRYFTLDLFFGTLLVLGILGFLGWGMSRMITEQRALDTTPTSALPAVIDVLMASPTPEATLEAEATPEESPMPADFIPTPFYTPSSIEAAFEVVVFPRAYTWVRVVTDGELSFEGRLVPGSARAFTAEDYIELLTGDYATLRIVFANNEIANNTTQFGVSRRLRFDANGITELPTVENREGTPVLPQTTPSFTPPPLKH